jgi:hypothetical protein
MEIELQCLIASNGQAQLLWVDMLEFTRITSRTKSLV